MSNTNTLATVSASKPSQYRGVYKCGKKWKSQIQINGKQEYLGIFATEDEAAVAYDIRAMEVGRMDCLNYAKRGGIGNASKLFQIIKKKIRLGRVLSMIHRKKKIFVELVSARAAILGVAACHDQPQRVSDLPQLFKLFCELQAQYQERDRGTKDVYSLITPAPPL